MSGNDEKQEQLRHLKALSNFLREPAHWDHQRGPEHIVNCVSHEDAMALRQLFFEILFKSRYPRSNLIPQIDERRTGNAPPESRALKAEDLMNGFSRIVGEKLTITIPANHFKDPYQPAMLQLIQDRIAPIETELKYQATLRSAPQQWEPRSAEEHIAERLKREKAAAIARAEEAARNEKPKKQKHPKPTASPPTLSEEEAAALEAKKQAAAKEAAAKPQHADLSPFDTLFHELQHSTKQVRYKNSSTPLSERERGELLVHTVTSLAAALDIRSEETLETAQATADERQQVSRERKLAEILLSPETIHNAAVSLGLEAWTKKFNLNPTETQNQKKEDRQYLSENPNAVAFLRQHAYDYPGVPILLQAAVLSRSEIICNTEHTQSTVGLEYLKNLLEWGSVTDHLGKSAQIVVLPTIDEMFPQHQTVPAHLSFGARDKGHNWQNALNARASNTTQSHFNR